MAKTCISFISNCSSKMCIRASHHAPKLFLLVIGIKFHLIDRRCRFKLRYEIVPDLGGHIAYANGTDFPRFFCLLHCFPCAWHIAIGLMDHCLLYTSDKPIMHGLTRTVGPMQLAKDICEAMSVLCTAGQPCTVVSGVMLGASGPQTMAGAYTLSLIHI